MWLPGAVVSCIPESLASFTGKTGKEVKPPTTVPGAAVLTHAYFKMAHAHSCL